MIITVNPINFENRGLVPEQEIKDLLTEIARTSRECYHRYYLKRKQVDWVLKKFPTMDDKLKSQLKFIKKNYKEKKSDLKRASTTLNIVLSENEFIRQEGSDWVVSHQSVMRNRFLEMPELLVENANSDGTLFEDIFNFEAKHRNIGPLCFDVQNGGSGGDLQNHFPRRLTKPSKKIVVCIGDRDSFIPQDEIPKKLKKLNEIISKKNSIGYAQLTPCTEIENFISTNVLKLLFFSEEDIQTISKIENLLSNQGTTPSKKCLYLYLDLKHGFDVDENKGGRFTAESFLGRSYVWKVCICL